MNVIARTDPHAAHQDVYDAHPDWIAVDAQRQEAQALGRPGTVGDVRTRAVQLRVHDRGDARDRAHVQRGRHLQQSLGRFRHVLLRALPAELQEVFGPGPAAHGEPAGSRRGGNTSSGGRSGCSNCGGSGTREIRKINPNASFIANAGGGALSDLDMKTIGELAPTLFADRQARRGLMPPWANGKNGKEYARDAGPQGHRRHLQRGRRRAVSLERLRPERRRDPALGG